MFENSRVTAAAFEPMPAEDWALDDEAVQRFDDSDGAYAVAEPDPFSTPPALPLRRPALRPVLRDELAAQPAGGISTLTTPALPPLPVPDGLRQLLPGGLRRGSTVAVTSSVSLLLTLLGAASAAGAWTALVGLPAISAEAAVEAGIELGRLAIVGPPPAAVREDGEPPVRTGPSWTTVVGTLLDAVDVVVAQPGVPAGTGGLPASGDRAWAGRASDGDARRLTARARSKGGILVLFGPQAASWPAVEIELSATHGRWTGIDRGYGRLQQRQLLLSATGRGRSARPRNGELWL